MVVRTVAVEAVVHGLHLLELLGGKDAGELLLGGLVDGAELRVAILRRERSVSHQRGHLLVAVGEDGLELGGLVGAEVELLAEEGGCLLGIGGVMAVVVGALDGRGGLLRFLGESEAAADGEGENCGEKDALHGW